MWIKNTSGKPDAMLTFAVISFAVVTANLLLSTIGSIESDKFSIGFTAMDAGIMTAYLGATFTAYVTRRWTDKKYITDEDAANLSPSEEEEL
tara:strand:- start:419 stop:694 length:276 start_codon:yes stop_codon:yes gene_type:complete